MIENKNDNNQEDLKLKIKIANSLVGLESLIKHYNKTNYISILLVMFLLFNGSL